MEVAVFESLRVRPEALEPHIQEVVNFLQAWSENKSYLAGSVYKQYAKMSKNLDGQGNIRYITTHLDQIPHQVQNFMIKYYRYSQVCIIQQVYN